MESKKNNTKLLATGIVAALGASLCCITPFLALIADVGGVASTFSWLNPLRPYFIELTILMLGFAWCQALKPTPQTSACACIDVQEQKPLG